MRQLQELERWQPIKEQILALRAKVGRSSKAEGLATIAVSALTVSLPTIAMHPAATVLPFEPATSAFAAGTPPTTVVNTAPAWGAIPPAPQQAYSSVYPYPLPPTRIPVPEPHRFKAQTMLE